MPFVRFSRDKRGCEYVYLVHAPVSRGGASRPRVLYWYRTPPGVRVGREPFDAPVREALEAQNPDLTFDWQEILEAQAPPPPEVEHWRERRRAERSAKLARAAREEPSAAPDPWADAVSNANSPGEQRAGEPATPTNSPEVAPSTALPEADTAASAEQPTGRQRRRGGRRRRRGEEIQARQPSTPLASDAPAVAAPPEPPPLDSSEDQDDETTTPFRPS